MAGVKRAYGMRVWMNETECAELSMVGGYWNDNDECGKDK